MASSLDPQLIIQAALLALDEVLQIISHIKGQGTLTTDEIAAIADKQDLANLEAIKALIQQ
jgi:hypothetical protein